MKLAVYERYIYNHIHIFHRLSGIHSTPYEVQPEEFGTETGDAICASNECEYVR